MNSLQPLIGGGAEDLRLLLTLRLWNVSKPSAAVGVGWKMGLFFDDDGLGFGDEGEEADWPKSGVCSSDESDTEGKGEELLILQQKFLVFNDERALFNRLMIELFKLDSDISGFDLDVLLHRSQFSEHQAGCGPKYVACSSSLLCLNVGKERAFLGVEQVEDSCVALLVESYVIRTRLPVTY
ncbi:DNA polymerase alpha catalytic subunit, partial [Cucurbita argyrosperma subsp. sororia]